MEWGKPRLSFLLKCVAIVRKEQLLNLPPAPMGLPGHCSLYLTGLLILLLSTSLRHRGTLDNQAWICKYA